mgnify:FL=1
MAKMDNPEGWEKIQRYVQETERLMGQKKYNLSIVKARQAMEFMVKLQCDKAGIVQGPTETMIRELYNGGWISKTTAEHYLQILSIGNKASKDGDNSASNANQAYHVLSQEIYSFADADKKPPRIRKSAANQPNRSRKKREKNGLNSSDLLKLLIPAALILVLICVIIMFTPKKTPTNETTEAPQTTAETTEALQTTAEVPTETSSEAVVYKTTTTLNVRKGPSTDTDRIGKLDPGVTVNYTGDYDDSWAIIQYNGQEAYVSKEYLTTE